MTSSGVAPWIFPDEESNTEIEQGIFITQRPLSVFKQIETTNGYGGGLGFPLASRSFGPSKLHGTIITPVCPIAT